MVWQTFTVNVRELQFQPATVWSGRIRWVLHNSSGNTLSHLNDRSSQKRFNLCAMSILPKTQPSDRTCRAADGRPLFVQTHLGIIVNNVISMMWVIKWKCLKQNRSPILEKCSKIARNEEEREDSRAGHVCNTGSWTTLEKSCNILLKCSFITIGHISTRDDRYNCVECLG